MNNQIYGFALGGTRKILYKLKNVDCCYILFPNNIHHYSEMILHDKPKYILGLGIYSGVDQDKIRIETTCTNKFRNGFIDKDQLQKVEINYWLKPNELMKTASGIGNSYCNFYSWKIMQLIKENELETQYTFLHIPKKMKWWLVAKEIDKVLGVVSRC